MGKDYDFEIDCSQDNASRAFDVYCIKYQTANFVELLRKELKFAQKEAESTAENVKSR
jgi:hypothetical protein